MAKRVQLRRGTTTENNSFTGAAGEVTVDTTKCVPVIHDGVTQGGFAVGARANTDGSVSLIGKFGDVVGHFTTGTNLTMYTPIPYSQATPPNGYLVMLGQAISQASYPILYSLYGTKLPDMRGEFIRGWDNGRGADSGRGIMSWQGDAIRNITGDMVVYTALSGANSGGGAFYVTDAGGSGESYQYGSTRPRFNFDASRVVPTAADNRPRNIAFNYIVKAG